MIKFHRMLFKVLIVVLWVYSVNRVHCKTAEEETIDILYGDLFSSPKDKGYRPTSTRPILPTAPGHRPRPTSSRPRPSTTPSTEETEGQRPELDSCCGTTRSTEPFLDDHRDASGVLWHAVWFNGTSMKAQYYEKVSCGNPSCSLVNTLRPFLMTKVRPHQAFGHSHAILNSNWLKNVKFLNHFVGGYCIRKGALSSNPILAVTRRPRNRNCFRSRPRRVKCKVRPDVVRRIRVPSD